VEKLCDRVAIMHDGKIIADLTKAEFTKNGASLEDTYVKLTEID
jgi:ABC-type multidrug transport system ATPase subunit